jgi:hypothetical protein
LSFHIHHVLHCHGAYFAIQSECGQAAFFSSSVNP